MLATVAALALVGQSYPPMIELNQLLETEFNLQKDTPTMRCPDIQIVFPPEGNFTMTMKVIANGQVIAEPKYQEPQYFGAFAEVRPKDGDANLGTSDGPRSIEIYVNDKLAGKFDFSLKKQVSGDAFERNVQWLIDGPWKDHGFLYHSTQQSGNKNINFTCWVGTREINVGDGRPAITLELRKGNSVVAKSDIRRLSAQETWNRIFVQFKVGNSFVTTNTIQSWSGEHTIHVMQDGRSIKSYKFSIASGSLVPHARSAYALEKPERFLSPRRLNAHAVSPNQYTWVAPN